MTLETMFFIAIGTVVDEIASMNAWAEYASTEDHAPFRNRAARKALKYRTKAIVNFDRTMDRLVKEYK